MAQNHEYVPGYKQIAHHEWRTAENSAAHLVPHLRDRAAKNPKLTLLDVGTGPGTIATSLASYMPEGHITATDVTDEVLDRARELASRTGAKNITFEVADIFNLSYGDDSFDVVHVHQVLCHLPDPVAALKELVRVTKPGGIVAVRESDLDKWTFWPETDALKRYHELQVQVHGSNGGGTNTGRRLVSFALEAGLKRDQIDMNFAAWSYNTPQDRKTFVSSMADRMSQGRSRDKILQLGITSEEELDRVVAGLKEFIEIEYATLGLIQGEMIIHK